MSVLGTVVKICVKCGTDVSQQRRIKDEIGNYLCATCWKAGLPVPHTILEPATESKSPSDSTLRDKGIVGMSLLVTITFAIAMFSVYFVAFRNTWERDNRDEITSIIDNGQYFASREAWKAAKEEFDRLFALIADNEVGDPELAREIAEARVSAAAVNARLAEITREQDEARMERVKQEQSLQRKRAEEKAIATQTEKINALAILKEQEVREKESQKLSADQSRRVRWREIVLSDPITYGVMDVESAVNRMIERYIDDPTRDNRYLIEVQLNLLLTKNTIGMPTHRHIMGVIDGLATQ